MSSLEVNASSSTCRMCGRAYGRLKGYFPVSYADLYKGTGYLPYCWDCITKIYTGYFTECGDHETATERLCRKLDLYWNRDAYAASKRVKSSRSILTNYLSRLTNAQYAGKCYEDTVREAKLAAGSKDQANAGEAGVINDVISYWGPGYTEEMYLELEKRRKYWISNLPDGVVPDVRVESLIRQICGQEIDINKLRSAGQPADKQAALLDKLVTSLLRPDQRNDGDADLEKPLGVWLYRYENHRPLPEIDDELKDTNGFIRYVLCWMLGPLSKMFGLKNKYQINYEKELEKYTVQKPEYDGDDDELAFSEQMLEDDDDAPEVMLPIGGDDL